MSDSGTRTFSAISDRYFTLAAEQFVREAIIPSGWNRLRIGALIGFQDSGANITNAQLAMGLCAGTAGSWNSGTRTHWGGIALNAAGTLTWTRATATNPNYGFSTTGAKPTRWQNNVQDSGTGSSVSHYAAINDGVAVGRRSPFICDLVKNGGSLQVPFHAVAQTDANSRDWTFENFMALMECSPAATNITDDLARSLTSFTHASYLLASFNEATYGTLTHFNLWWNKSTPKLEVYGYAVQRLD